MKFNTLSLAIGCVICVFASFNTASAQNFGKLFVVDTVGDTHDAVPGDTICADAIGKCSLRAAIEESNVTPNTRDAIIFALPNPSVIDLALGELAITGKVAIVGPGARRLTIQRNFAVRTPTSRIFHLTAAATNSIVRNLKIRNGISDINGGGILVDAGAVVTVSDLWITANQAGTGGGIANAGNLNIVRTLIDSNQVNIFGAENKGGGVANLTAQSILKVTNSTITANQSSISGAIDNAGSVTLINSTLAGNFASDSCSTMCNRPGGTVSAINTIIGPDSQASRLNALSGAFTSLGNNIVTDARGTTGFVNGTNGDQVSDANAINALLGSLSNNGGETDSLPLLTGSPAIDQGNSCVLRGTCSGLQVFIFTDQRSGFLRSFFNPVDIGAFEFNAAMGGSISSFIGSISPNRPAIAGGSIRIATNATTLQKVYSVLNPFGHSNLNLQGGVWIIELRAKRAAVGMDPLVTSSEDSFPLSIAASVINTVFRQSQPKVEIK